MLKPDISHIIDAPDEDTGTIKTGDTSHITIIAVIFIISLALMFILAFIKIKKKKYDE